MKLDFYDDYLGNLSVNGVSLVQNLCLNRLYNREASFFHDVGVAVEGGSRVLSLDIIVAAVVGTNRFRNQDVKHTKIGTDHKSKLQDSVWGVVRGRCRWCKVSLV